MKAIIDKPNWDSCLLQMESYDFYHTYDYHNVLKKEGEEPILLFYEEDKFKIAIPFLKRFINFNYFDVTSVHGYLGPIKKNIDSSFDNTKFKKELIFFFKENNIVSAYSKLNPFIEGQNGILNSIGKIEQMGELVFFDQTMESELQMGFYNRNTRQKIKQLKNMCTVKFAETEDEIDSFVELYHKGMDRLKAKDIFYFDRNYFNTLFKSKLFKANILLAINNETKDIMGGVFCLTSNEIAHIELACTNESYLRNSPVRILFDFCRNHYKNKQIKFLNLGGGSGGRDGSLMKFKATFTNCFIDFHLWKFIAMPHVYENLISDLQLRSNTDFFPKYRLQL